jgi:hypothetical protein
VANVHPDDPAGRRSAGAVAAPAHPAKQRSHTVMPTRRPHEAQRPKIIVDAGEDDSGNTATQIIQAIDEPLPTKRSKTARKRHRVHLGRLLSIVAVALLASAGVAVAGERLLPPEPVPTMADPDFDVAAFYETHQVVADGGREIAYAHTPGEQATPKVIKPVAGLTQAETDNAYIIIEVGKQMNLPKRAYIVAIATSLQETHLRNLANSKVSASLKLNHQGVGSNFDSVGLFQQRPSQGWGTAAQLMDPAQSSARFYARLTKVDNWPSLSIAGAAQAVQRSAFATAYAKHTDKATDIVDKLLAT